jgi:hypothetical protein
MIYCDAAIWESLVTIEEIMSEKYLLPYSGIESIQKISF